MEVTVYVASARQSEVLVSERVEGDERNECGCYIMLTYILYESATMLIWVFSVCGREADPDRESSRESGSETPCDYGLR